MAAGSAIGYIGALVAVMCFGTYAVPTKFINTGDGMMFQWVCIFILSLLYCGFFLFFFFILSLCFFLYLYVVGFLKLDTK